MPRPVTILSAALVAVLLVASFTTRTSTSQNELSVLMEPDGTGIWRDLIARFNSTSPEIRVRLVEGPPSTNAREDMYSTAFLSGGSGYDIIYSDLIWIPKFAAAGWLLDLSDRLDAADRSDFLAADIEGGTYDGRLYRIPAFTDAGLLYYRKDLLPAAPATFQELIETANRFRTEERTGYVWQGKQYEGLVTNYLEILWGMGGDWISPQRSVLLDRPEALEALRFLKSTVGTISPPGVTTYMEEDTRTLFQNGRAVFLRNWLYVWALIGRSENEVKGKVAFAPMVHGPNGTSAATLGGWGFAISRASPHPDVAWKFVEFITRPEQLDAVFQRNGRIPARQSMMPAEFLPIARNARPRPQIPEYAQASDILQRWLSAALTDRVSAEEALREAAHETRLLLGTQ